MILCNYVHLVGWHTFEKPIPFPEHADVSSGAGMFREPPLATDGYHTLF